MDPLNYGEYLKVKELISLQVPQSDPLQHDELLFIITHQTYELWFKLLLSEFDEVIANFRMAAGDPEERDAVYEAARLLRRCTEIARILVAQFTVLETMLPTHFAAFRNRLGTASGFQSEQFRELEFLCGLKDEKMLRMHEPSGAMYDQLLRRLRDPPFATRSLKRWLTFCRFPISRRPIVSARARAGDSAVLFRRECLSRLDRRLRAPDGVR